MAAIEICALDLFVQNPHEAGYFVKIPCNLGVFVFPHVVLLLFMPGVPWASLYYSQIFCLYFEMGFLGI